MVGVGVVGAALAMAWAWYPRSTDYDTWSQLGRMRLQYSDRISTSARPLYYVLINALYRSANPAQLDALDWLRWTTVPAVIALWAALVAFRRELFGSGAIAPAAAAFLSFLVSPAGEFLCDTWNDHLALVPLYIVAWGLLLRFPAQPRRAAVMLAMVFLVQSLLHSIEPWLWAAALPALIFLPGVARRSGPSAAATFLVCLGITAPILLAFGNASGGAKEFVASYAVDSWTGAFADQFADAFSQGGGAWLPAPILWPLGGAWLIAVLLLALRGRWREILGAMLLGGAALFPAVYEGANPERHYTLGLVLSVLGARGAVAWGALRRLRPGARRAAARRLSGAVAVAIMVAGLALWPSRIATLGDVALQPSWILSLRQRIGPSAAMVITYDEGFWLHAQQMGPAAHTFRCRNADDLAQQLPRITMRPIVFTAAAAKLLDRRDQRALAAFWEYSDSIDSKLLKWPAPSLPRADTTATQIQLSLDAIEVLPATTAPLTLRPGDQLTWRCTVTNHSPRASGPVPIELFQSGNGGYEPIPAGTTLTPRDTREIPPLSTASFEFRQPVLAAMPGDFHAMGIINRQTMDGPTEPVLDDNIRTARQPLRLLAADPTCNLHWVTTPTLSTTGGVWTLFGQVMNDGPTTAPPFWTQAGIGKLDPDGFFRQKDVLGGGVLIQDLAPGEKRPFVVRVPKPEAQAQAEVIGIRVDCTGTVPELDETDNSALLPAPKTPSLITPLVR